VDLPTYTSIWRIEKRLYKLYDFRLPMPLPVGQIAVFAGIAVPYVILLTVAGLPFSHTLFWLYVLPPGVLTWLATRPVLESKRLPELIISQVRYLSEPRTLCRLAPLAEEGEIQVSARVWRRARGPADQPAPGEGQAPDPAGQEALADGARGQIVAAQAPGPGGAAGAADREHSPRRRAVFPLPGPSQLPPRARPGHPLPPAPPAPAPEFPAAPQRLPAAPGGSPAVVQGSPAPAQGTAAASQRPPAPQPQAVTPGRLRAPERAHAEEPAHHPESAAAAHGAGQDLTARKWAAPPVAPDPASAAGKPSAAAAAAGPPPAAAQHPPGAPAGPRAGDPGTATAPRTVRVVAAGQAPARPAPLVERALSGPASQRSMSWHDHVTVVPGGHGPGQPERVKRDRIRAVAPLGGPRLVAVLGCSVGAGQTVTALMLAGLLARLREEPVAALDLNPGPASLTRQAQATPAATVSALLAGRAGAMTEPGTAASGPGRLDVIAADAPAQVPLPAGDLGHQRLHSILASRYPLVVADPGAVAVARTLAAADQLVLVAPASPDAARAAAMTLEWLDANRYGTLLRNAIAVMNGVSKRSAVHAGQAEAVLRGRCRAIVRVPWDAHLGEITPGIPGSQPGSRLDRVRPAVLDAYTALAGVLVTALAAAPAQRAAGCQPAVPRASGAATGGAAAANASAARNGAARNGAARNGAARNGAVRADGK
jgi:MinD-like ATPase involved in chromosome partitioning or flagellar assembly